MYTCMKKTFLSDNPHRGDYHGMHAWRLKHQAFADVYTDFLYYACIIQLELLSSESVTIEAHSQAIFFVVGYVCVCVCVCVRERETERDREREREEREKSVGSTLRER